MYLLPFDLLDNSDNVSRHCQLNYLTLTMTTRLSDAITLTTRGKIAIITLNLPKKLNALTQDLYYHLSCLMRDVAARDDIYITILTGKGRYFSACVALLRPSGCSVLIKFFQWCRRLNSTFATRRHRCEAGNPP